MNTAMADGASERLDEQIADALFGQPGMSKMDVANRLRQLRGAGAPLFCSSCYGLGVIGYTSGQSPEQFEQGEYPCPDCAAQPAPAGQGDASSQFEEWARPRFRGSQAFDRIDDRPGGWEYNGNDVQAAWSGWKASLAARQPVVQEPAAVVTTSDRFTYVKLNRELPDGTGLYVASPERAWVVADGQGARWRMWGSFGPAWTSDRDQALHFARRADAEAFANDDEDAWLIQPASAPAQAVDRPYSLDADPAGIRALVADAITGTLWVGAQGHTQPPADHWLAPFWEAAKADARVQEKVLEALSAAAKSLRTIASSTRDTEFLETASEIRAYAGSRASCAELALIDSKAVGNGQ